MGSIAIEKNQDSDKAKQNEELVGQDGKVYRAILAHPNNTRVHNQLNQMDPNYYVKQRRQDYKLALITE